MNLPCPLVMAASACDRAVISTLSRTAFYRRTLVLPWPATEPVPRLRRGGNLELAMAIAVRLFAYGTLRMGMGHAMHQVLAPHATFIGEGTVSARLFNLGSYPGIVLSDQSGDRVIGDVFHLAPESAGSLLSALDDYEGIGPAHPLPHEYAREAVDVLMSDGRSIRAWAYVLTDPLPSWPRIVTWPLPR